MEIWPYILINVIYRQKSIEKMNMTEWILQILNISLKWFIQVKIIGFSNFVWNYI